MSKSIKFLIIGLFLVAGLVVARIGFLFSRNLDLATANISATTKVDYQNSNDYDNDGLSNADEAYWNTDPYKADSDGDGYLDGEEVASGHDPSIAGPNDLLANTRAYNALNSTQRLAQLVTGGIIAGDLKPGDSNPNFQQSVDHVADATIYATLASIEETKADPPDNVVENSKAAEENYINTVYAEAADQLINSAIKEREGMLTLFYVDETAPDGISFTPPQIEKIKNAYLKYADQFQQAGDALKTVPVPRALLETNSQLTNLLKKLESYHRNIALTNNDPMKQIFLLSNLQNVYLQALPILQQLDNFAKTNTLTTNQNNLTRITQLLNSK